MYLCLHKYCLICIMYTRIDRAIPYLYYDIKKYKYEYCPILIYVSIGI